MVRDTCYRFTAKDGYNQSYFTTPPLVFIDENNMECDMYYSNNNKKVKQQTPKKNEGII